MIIYRKISSGLWSLISAQATKRGKNQVTGKSIKRKRNSWTDRKTKRGNYHRESGTWKEVCRGWGSLERGTIHVKIASRNFEQKFQGFMRHQRILRLLRRIFQLTFGSLRFFFYSDVEPLSKYSPVTLHLTPVRKAYSRVLNILQSESGFVKDQTGENWRYKCRLTEMPASEDLKSGDSFFCTIPPLESQCPPPLPHKMTQPPKGVGHYMKSYMEYIQSNFVFITVMMK